MSYCNNGPTIVVVIAIALDLKQQCLRPIAMAKTINYTTYCNPFIAIAMPSVSYCNTHITCTVSHFGIYYNASIYIAIAMPLLLISCRISTPIATPM